MFVPLPYFVTSHKTAFTPYRSVRRQRIFMVETCKFLKLKSVYPMYVDDKISSVGKTGSILFFGRFVPATDCWFLTVLHWSR